MPIHQSLKTSACSARFPSLDGIRCIAVGLVFFAHSSRTHHFNLPADLYKFSLVGNLGVRIFFVLSGFLITSLLLREQEKFGRISLVNFYIRRTVRIFPALYVFVAIISIANVLGWIQLSLSDLLHSLTYTQNYHYGRDWVVGHLWSLAVEEQFYLLWPLSLVLLGTRRGLFLAFFIVLAVPFIRVFTWEFLPTQRVGIGESFQTICDALATGCLLASLRQYWGCVKLFGRSLGGILVPIIAFSILALNYFRGYISISYTVGETLMNVGIALLIDWAIRKPYSKMGLILNSKPFVYIGTLSYSLYLWQQPFLNKASDSILCAFPLNIVLAFVAAVLSFHFVEQPLLNLRSRYRVAKAAKSVVVPVPAGEPE